MKQLATTLLALLGSAVLSIPATFDIGWDARPISEGVTGYVVYSGPTNATVRLSPVSPGAVGINSARITLPDGAYRLTVTATNAVDESLPSLPLYVVVTGTNVIAVTTKPGAPLNVQLR